MSALTTVTSIACLLLMVPIAHGTTPDKIPDVSYPALPVHGKTIVHFVPKGWKLEEQVQGDLDGNGSTDIMLMLHDNDPHNVVAHSDTNESPLNTNPRMLVVLFKAANGDFTRVLANHTLIPRRENPVMSDPINGVTGGNITIAGGVLQVSLGWFPSAGGWEMGYRTLSFRWRKGHFLLTRLDSSTINRRSGKTIDKSYNYRTRRVKYVTGSISGEKEPSVAWHSLPPAPLLTLKELGDGLAFDPERTPASQP